MHSLPTWLGTWTQAHIHAIRNVTLTVLALRYTIKTINNNSHKYDNSDDNEQSNSPRQRYDETAVRPVSET